MGKRLAALTSNIFNPFLVSFAVILLFSFKATSGTAAALKWAAIAIALSVLPVWLFVIYLVRQRRMDGIFGNSRQQRNLVYVLAIACAIAGCLVLYYLEAPRLLLATFVAGLAATFVFMGINLVWKISLHTAFAAASVTVLTMVYGAPLALTALLLPPIGWARVEMGHHSPAQVISGALLAPAITFTVFYLFGLAFPRP